MLLSGVVGLLFVLGSTFYGETGSQTPANSHLLSSSDFSSVEQMNSPDEVVERAERTFRHFWRVSQGGFDDPFVGSIGTSAMLSTMADAHSVSWANFAMNDMSSEPRQAWNNAPGYAYAKEVFGPWENCYKVIKDGILVRRALNRMPASNFDDPARVEAFVEFTTGLAYGYLASFYDQAFILPNDTNLRAWENEESPRDPEAYGQVLDKALSALDRSIQIAENNSFSVGSELTFSSDVALTNTEFAQLAKSYKARYAAQVARTPQERSSLSYTNAAWSDVKSWIENGLEANGYSGPFAPVTVDYVCRDINCSDQFNIPNQRSKTTPAGFAPRSQGGFGTRGFDLLKWMSTQSNTWSRADYRTIGPADNSNGADDCNGDVSGDDGKISCFKEWGNTIDSPADWSNSFGPYVTETPDRRIQGPDGPQDHGKYFDFVGTGLTSFPPSRGSYHYSDRTFVRYQYHPEDGGPSAGEPMPVLTKPEMDLLKAEAILHMDGDQSQVAGLINNTRVDKGELPPAESSDQAGSITDKPNPVPGFRGEPTLWSMLKHEFNIETFASGGGVTYFADRGWGDLVEGTAKQLPKPGRILILQGRSLYTFGGTGSDEKRQMSSVDAPSTVEEPVLTPPSPQSPE